VERPEREADDLTPSCAAVNIHGCIILVHVIPRDMTPNSVKHNFIIPLTLNAISLYFCRISGFRREVDESCALLGHYTASSGDSLRTFRDNLSVPSERS
jgi:hypothetical protein